LHRSKGRRGRVCRRFSGPFALEAALPNVREVNASLVKGSEVAPAIREGVAFG
jgi:hypothetical protein